MHYHNKNHSAGTDSNRPEHDHEHDIQNDHNHSHGHHGHNHDHSIQLSDNDPGRRFQLGIALNLIFVIIEASFGFISGSMALLADAGHNLGDVLSLVLALVAVYLGRRAPSGRFTYGFGRVSVNIAVINGALLMGTAGIIAWEAMERFSEPTAVPGLTVICVAAAGVLVNLGATLLFVKGSKEDLNIRGAFLHLAADALVSLGVVIGGVLIYFTGWFWIDPLLSLLIVAVILYSTMGLLSDSFKLSLDAVPDNIDLPELEATLNNLPGVESFHDLHVRALSTTRSDLSVHLVRPRAKGSQDNFLKQIREILEKKFQIGHSSIQIETTDLACGCGG